MSLVRTYRIFIHVHVNGDFPIGFSGGAYDVLKVTEKKEGISIKYVILFVRERFAERSQIEPHNYNQGSF